MSNELQTVKQEVEATNGVERARATRVYRPPVDIFSADDQIVIQADMPGVNEDNIDIVLEKNVLTITGYVASTFPEGFDLAHGEYGIGDFQRTFTLPDEIDRDGIAATLNEGVLRMELPKAPEAQARRITVKAG